MVIHYMYDMVIHNILILITKVSQVKIHKRDLT